MTIPFRVGELVTGEFFTDRVEEVERILGAMRDPTRLLVYGERRQGKSSAIRFAAERFEQDGGVLLWVDVSTASSFGDIARRLISSVPYSWVWRQDLQTKLLRASVRIEARTDLAGNPVLALALEPLPGSTEHGKEELQRSVRVLDKLAEERNVKIAIVLDEFQQIAELVDRGEWVLRDLMQTTHNLSFLCAGSRASLIDQMLSKDGAFHRFFEPLNIRAMDPEHLAAWIGDRMRGSGVQPQEGVGHEIVRLVGPRTQDCLQLARAVFVAGQQEGAASVETVKAALRQSAMQDGDRFETAWSSLPRSQQLLLRAIALGEEELFSSKTARKHGLPPSSSISRALSALRAKRHIVEGEEPRIDDPFFRVWILIRAMPDGLPGGS